jgi:hypothetical protein
MVSSSAPHRRSREKKTDQLTDIAVSLKGWAMLDGMRRRKENEIICARPINSKPSADLISLHQKSGIPLTETFRSASKYTPEELAPLSAFTRHYLVVGYAPRYPTVDLLERNPAISYPKKVGQERPGNVIEWKKDEPPILVVADISSKKREKTQLWALLCPKDGLCTPYQISRNVVFFRWEFRTPATAYSSRSKLWMEVVRVRAYQPVEEEEEDVDTQVIKEESDGDVVMVDTMALRTLKSRVEKESGKERVSREHNTRSQDSGQSSDEEDGEESDSNSDGDNSEWEEEEVLGRPSRFQKGKGKERRKGDLNVGNKTSGCSNTEERLAEKERELTEAWQRLEEREQEVEDREMALEAKREKIAQSLIACAEGVQSIMCEIPGVGTMLLASMERALQHVRNMENSSGRSFEGTALD